MDRQQVSAHIASIASQLGEHFDAVQILATRMAPEGGGTERFACGSGNWYARQGMAQHFIKMDEADTLSVEIGRKLEPPPDDSESWKRQ